MKPAIFLALKRIDVVQIKLFVTLEFIMVRYMYNRIPILSRVEVVHNISIRVRMPKRKV